MAEKIAFHFQGALADEHRMNFYESARFQYAAARLMVKLAQFRANGRFVKKIFDQSNINIQLIGHTDGSFNINIEDSGQKDDDEQFVKVLLSDMIAYVSERIVEKLDADVLAEGLLLSPAPDLDDSEKMAEVDAVIDLSLNNDALFALLPTEAKDLIRRRVAESHREKRLAENAAAISKIDSESGRRLVAMAAPLLSEMAQIGLRRSAESLEIRSSLDGQTKSVLFLDKGMAKAIETSIVDEEITPLLCDVIQFNKDNGWGKVRIEKGLLTLSFSIPSDKLSDLKQALIDQMKKDLVYLQTYQVRDRAGVVTRLIVVGILETPEGL